MLFFALYTTLDTLADLASKEITPLNDAGEENSSDSFSRGNNKVRR